MFTSDLQRNTMNYKGYIIEKETEAWPLYFGNKFRYFHPDGEVIHHAVSIEDAQEMIDMGPNDTYQPYADPTSWDGGFADNH